MKKIILSTLLIFSFNINADNNLWVEYFKTKDCHSFDQLQDGDTLLCYSKDISPFDKDFPKASIDTNKFWNIDLSRNKISNSNIFSNVNYIVNDLNLHSNLFIDINGLYNLEHVGRFINISNNPLLDIDGLSNLKNAQGIYITHTGIENIDSLKKIKNIRKDLLLKNNQLINVNGLMNIVYIGGKLDLSQNKLFTLNGLNNLRQVSTINLQQNYNLTDLTALSNVENVNVIIIDSQKYNELPSKNSNFCNNYLFRKLSLDGEKYLSIRHPLVLPFLKSCL